MAELHRRAVVSAPRMSAEEIVSRGFASAFRGLSETEVRNFLRRVADEVDAASAREADLVAEIDTLRERLRNPAPVTEQQLLDSLGEETARVLRSAQEAAEEIRSRAEERAGTLVREAQEEATRLRETAGTEVAEREEEVERVASERERAADAYATRARDDAERDAGAARAAADRESAEVAASAAAAAAAEIDASKEQGRALVQEARAVRERVLGDLGRRRTLLQAQVDELRAGRDRLLDAYRVVKRTLGEATDALVQVEARAGEALAGPPPPVAVPPVEGELDALGGLPEEQLATVTTVTVEEVTVDGVTVEDVTVEEVTVEEVGSPVAPVGPPSQGPGGDDSGAAVDALFARLRAEKTETVEAVDLIGPAGRTEPDAPSARAGEPDPAEPDAAADPDAAEPDAAGEPEPSAAVPPAPEPGSDDERRAQRAAIVDPAVADLTRRAKRALQDEQNELLDRLRQVKKGRPASAEVLPSRDEVRTRWVDVLADSVAAAYRGGWEQADGSPPAAAPTEVVTEHADAMVDALRDRLVTAIDTGDEDAITSRLGARFREFKAQDLEVALGDVLAAAWVRGTYDAAPAGTRLRWVPTEVGQCPDCDDNALEPTVRGEPFPTGQALPPAHPGCRCLLAIAES